MALIETADLWKTYEMGADLIRRGLDVGKINELTYDNHPFRRVELMRALLNTLELSDCGVVANWMLRDQTRIDLELRPEDSEGLIDDEYTPREQADGCEAIAWIARQNWCTGSVGMVGISWGGFNGLQIAALQPPALKTVITVGSTDDRYATDIHWVGGCLSKDNFDWSATMLANNDLPPDPEIVGEKWRAMWEARVKHNQPWILTWLKHQRRAVGS